ncbi:NAD-dependent epimerase/dehydratase family protein [Longimicrobium terrae]|uniref:Nucleoside-diphosphate-sugar epimerase n=1 Tax=Longimicrobium terrae TaxID=1639882 RepID=A0A841H4P7_9BACT|nr:NAD-dependent epimerase/dehydratase family protein [Longimicrobium terrae]MBB4638715.1 nucleoside-diphosphate-sugar epimerase [Longimicrobium terrae]MBB6072954.1 nucleoside-diphosphate-sugar epimerase [Longimicrobium terrae]NNC31566.1 NAD-dependent epimerase/dehydratase family protein [Longimicrobium terrae]
MKIFITGASGYIGGVVASHFAGLGHDVTALARSEESAARLSSAGFRVHRGDVSDPASFVSAVAAADGVVHAAVGGARGVTADDEAALEAMVGALEGRGAPLILTSGLGVYAGMQAAVVDEDTPMDAAIPQQQARVRLEQQAVRAAERGVRTVVIRPANVYGQGGAGLFTRLQLEYAERTGAGAVPGDGSAPFVTVHADDLAAAYAAALERAPAGSVYNLAGQSHTFRELAGAMSHAVGGGGRTVALSADEAREAWGPLAALITSIPAISALRATVELGWTPRAPSLTWELTHGSLLRAGAEDARQT